MMNKYVKGILVAAMMTVLASCGGVGTDDPSQLTIDGVARENSNRGLPTTIRIYALSSDHLFYGYDYFSLTLEDETVLGVTLKGVLDEVYLEPGESAVFGPYDLPRNTRIVGVVGTFKNVDNAKWRDTTTVVDRGEQLQAYISIDGDSIQILNSEEYEEAKRLAEEQAEAQAEAEKQAAKAAEEKAKAAEKAAKEAEKAAKEAEKQAAEQS